MTMMLGLSRLTALASTSPILRPASRIRPIASVEPDLASATTSRLDPASIPAIVLETPPRRALGDLACPVAFELARRLRKAPRAIAQEVVGALEAIDGIARADAAPGVWMR